MKKVLVTGGAGFIGSHIVDQLLSKGFEVRVMDDLSSGVESNLAQGVKLYKMDVRSDQVKSLINEYCPDIVVHAAAQISVRVSMENPKLDADINVVGLVNLLQAFEGKTLPHFVFISTGGAIYGEQEAFPADENHPVAPTSIYGLSKRVCEMYLDFWARQMGLKYTSLRLANVYGPRQNPHGEAGVVAIFSKMLLAGKTPTINGDGKQTRDFVFVKDVANAVCAVVEGSVSGIYNIGTALETNVNQLYGYIVSSLGLDIKPSYGPAKSGEQMRSVINWNKAKATFAWSPKVSIEKGIAETTGWFKGH